MRTTWKIALVIATAFVADPVLALPPGTVYDVNLVVAGSSSLQSSFRSQLATMCSDTLDAFTTQLGGPDMQAYSCTLNASAGSGLTGKKAIVYYRGEGGSVWGVGPIAKSISILRLNPTAAGCSGSSPSYTCPVSGYSINTDTITSGAAISATVRCSLPLSRASH